MFVDRRGLRPADEAGPARTACWFATRPIDYDPAVNDGSWPWAASTGADAQPWFRTFDPWRPKDIDDPGCASVRTEEPFAEAPTR